jgi:DNA-binding CsgD family transcriptional regulator
VADEPSGSAIRSDTLSKFGSQAALHLRAGFDRSRHPMLITDDQRRWVTANGPARKLLGVSALDLPWQSMDEFTTVAGRRQLQEQWQAFLTNGAAEGWYELSVADRGTVSVEFSAIAHVLPSRHLTVFIEPDAGHEPPQPPSEHEIWAAVPAGGGRSTLTAREREVITLIAGGAQSGEIGASLFLSPETVNSHAHNALAKLGAHTRAHAVAIALVTGQIVWSMHDPKPAEPPAD